MKISEVRAFMKEVGWGSLATTDGKKVGVRPMAGWAWVGEELWCATGTPSDKVAQLKKVPYAEYCFCSKEGKHVRIAGNCEVSSDNGDKLRLYELVPSLKEYVQDPKSPEYAIIRMKPERMRVMESADMVYKDVKLG